MPFRKLMANRLYSWCWLLAVHLENPAAKPHSARVPYVNSKHRKILLESPPTSAKGLEKDIGVCLLPRCQRCASVQAIAERTCWAPCRQGLESSAAEVRAGEPWEWVSTHWHSRQSFPFTLWASCRQAAWVSPRCWWVTARCSWAKLPPGLSLALG